MCRGMSEVSRPISRDAPMMHIMPAPPQSSHCTILPVRLKRGPLQHAHSTKTATEHRLAPGLMNACHSSSWVSYKTNHCWGL